MEETGRAGWPVARHVGRDHHRCAGHTFGPARTATRHRSRDCFPRTAATSSGPAPPHVATLLRNCRSEWHGIDVSERPSLWNLNELVEFVVGQRAVDVFELDGISHEV